MLHFDEVDPSEKSELLSCRTCMRTVNEHGDWNLEVQFLDDLKIQVQCND